MRPFAPRMLPLTVVLLGCSDTAVPVAESSSSETSSTSTDASAATSSDEVGSTALDSTAASDSSSSDDAAAESSSSSETGTPMPNVCDSDANVEFTVIVSANPSLTTLDGLDALVSTTDLFISGNPLLPQAEAEAFAASVDVAGELVVCGNLDGPPC